MVNLFFYLLALGAVLFAIGVVIAKNPVSSVLSLLGSFFCLSVIYLLAGFQLLAAIQILVYAGAIMVLFLFVVMLLNLGNVDAIDTNEPLFAKDRLPAALGLGVAGGILLTSVIAILGRRLPEIDPVVAASGVDSSAVLDGSLFTRYAELMFTRYALPFEAASLLLLAAAVGVLVLAKRERGGTTQEDSV